MTSSPSKIRLEMAKSMASTPRKKRHERKKK
jgi:hypothetical protein